MGLLEQLIMEVCSVAESWIIVEFISNILVFKSKVKFEKTAKACLIILLCMLMHLNGEFPFSETVVILGSVLCVYIYSTIFLRQTKSVKLFWILIPELFVAVINIFMLQVLAILKTANFEQWNYYIAYNSLLCLSKILLCAILYATYRVMKDEKITLEKDEYGIVFILMNGLLILEACIFYLMEQVMYLQMRLVLLVVSCILIILDYIVLRVMYRLHINREENLRIQILNIQNQELKRQIQDMDGQQEKIRRLGHDYKNHCTIIRELLEKEEYIEAVQYLGKMEQIYLKNTTEFIKVNHPAIQAILNSKIQLCMNNEIEVHANSVGDLSRIKGMEICVILMNLLDNAIESARKQRIKKMDIGISMEENYLYILIKNAIDCSVLETNPHLNTRKDGEHGYGLKNIRTILEKCDGIEDIYEEKGAFCVRVMIPTFIQNNKE